MRPHLQAAHWKVLREGMTIQLARSELVVVRRPDSHCTGCYFTKFLPDEVRCDRIRCSIGEDLFMFKERQ